MPDLHQELLKRTLAAMGEKAPDPFHDYTRQEFKREDGSTKGRGFLGALPLPNAFDPGVASEFSTADSATGPDYPTLVPTLTAAELNKLLNHIESGVGKVPGSVYDKARAFKAQRERAGKPLFAQEGEQNYDVLPTFQRIK